LYRSIGKNNRFWKNEIEPFLKVCIDNLETIYQNIPSYLGFSKKAKSHLKKFLSDEIRNKDLWHKTLHLLN
jgi:hypothetical protein